LSTPFGWQTQIFRMRLIGEECGACGEKIFPPRDICNNCGNSGTVAKKEGNLNFSIKYGETVIGKGKERGG